MAEQQKVEESTDPRPVSFLPWAVGMVLCAGFFGIIQDADIELLVMGFLVGAAFTFSAHIASRLGWPLLAFGLFLLGLSSAVGMFTVYPKFSRQLDSLVGPGKSIGRMILISVAVSFGFLVMFAFFLWRVTKSQASGKAEE